METLKSWIRQHQLAAFFIITFTISWGPGFSFYKVFQSGYELLFPLAAIAICSPALAGITVAKVSNTEPKGETTPIMLLFSPIVISPVAYVFSSAFSRIPSVRHYLSSVYLVRRVGGWLLLAPVVMLGIDLLSIWFSNLLGKPTVILSNLPFSGFELVKMLVISFLYQLLFFNLSGEEIGWRGFALARLLVRTNPMIASLVLTFFWAIYHAFYWGALGDPVLPLQYWVDTWIRLFPATRRSTIRAA